MTDRERPLRVGIWRAVSSKPQADKISLDDQQDAGERFAESIGGEVVATYTVPGHTRSPYVFWHEAEAEMAAYRQVREDLEAGKLDVIHAVDSDRLGRDAALIAQFESLAHRHGCEVYKASAPHPIGQQTAGHRYLSAIMGVRAEEDSALRVYRHRMGMKGRIRDGLMPTRPRYGYEPIRDEASGETTGYQWTPDIEAVRFATDFFLRGVSYARITRRLAEAGYPAPRGGGWHLGTVARILADDTYAGFPSWGPYVAEERSGRFPALWDEATHQAVIRERERRKRAPYVREGGSPFAGVAKCARCGGPMHYLCVRDGDSLYTYARCGTHAQQAATGVACHPNHMPTWRLVEAVSNWLAGYASPERIDEALAELDGSLDREQLAADLAAQQRSAAVVVEQRERLALALARGSIHPDMYRTTDDGLLAQLEAIEEQSRSLERQIEALPDAGYRREALARLAGEFAMLVELAEPGEIASLLQAAGVRVLCENGQVVGVGI